MSSILAHACAGIIANKAINRDFSLKNNILLFGFCIFLSLLPDIDVLIHIAFRFTNLTPHRGATHSLSFALATSAILAIATSKYFDISKKRLFSVYSLSILSHIALDYLMGAGPPVPLFAPFSYRGFLSPIRFVPSAFYSQSLTGLLQILFYPPAIFGYVLEYLIFIPIIYLSGKGRSKREQAVFILILVFALAVTCKVYNSYPVNQ